MDRPVSNFISFHLELLTYHSIGSTWYLQFTADIVADVVARTLTAETPNYATIMELDKKVREFPMPEPYSHSASDFRTSIQQCVLDHIRETGKFSSIMIPPL